MDSTSSTETIREDVDVVDRLQMRNSALVMVRMRLFDSAILYETQKERKEQEEACSNQEQWGRSRFHA